MKQKTTTEANETWSDNLAMQCSSRQPKTRTKIADTQFTRWPRVLIAELEQQRIDLCPTLHNLVESILWLRTWSLSQRRLSRPSDEHKSNNHLELHAMTYMNSSGFCSVSSAFLHALRRQDTQMVEWWHLLGSLRSPHHWQAFLTASRLCATG